MKSTVATESFPDYTFKLLYNKPGHVLLNGKQKLLYLNYTNNRNEIKSSWCIPLHAHVKLPLSAPFACPELNNLSAKEASDYILSAVDILKQYQVESMEITLPPEAYQGYKSSLIAEILLGEGFEVKKVINHFLLPVQKEKTFEKRIKDIQLRKLKKAKKEKFVFQHEYFKRIKEVYQFIYEQRQNKKYSLSLSIQKIKKIINEFPNQVKLFSLSKDNKMVAACIAILPDDEICYTLYYDQDIQYKNLSPNVLLLEGIYNWCAENNIKLIDLGSAHLNNKPNLGLQDFKLNAGSFPSARFTLFKTL